MTFVSSRTIGRVLIAVALCLAFSGALAQDDISGRWLGRYNDKGTGGPEGRGHLDLDFIDQGAMGTFDGEGWTDADDFGKGSLTVSGDFRQTGRQLQPSVTVTGGTDGEDERQFVGRVSRKGTRMKWKTTDHQNNSELGKIKVKFKRPQDS